MINNNDPRCYTYKKQRTAKKSNGLYIVYNLSDEDRQSDLYTDYIKIENKKHLQDTRRSYLTKQEKKYKMNKREFPEWATQELQFLRTIKNNNNSRYRRNNWALIQRNNIENNKIYQSIAEDAQNNNCTNDGACLLEQYNIKKCICEQICLADEKTKKQLLGKPKTVISKENYNAMLLNKKRNDKEKYNEMAREAGLPHSRPRIKKPKIKKIFQIYKINKQTPINVSNTIDLDEDKMEQNQQINA